MSGASIEQINQHLRNHWVYGITLWSLDHSSKLEIRVCDDERILSIREEVLMGYAQLYFHSNVG